MKSLKKKVSDIKSGDTVKVHQKIKEGGKVRVQIFEGLVIKVSNRNSHTATIKVRKVASGVGVERTFLLHSPLVEKVEVVKRSQVNRNYLTYMRNRSGKSARLDSVSFDKETVNAKAEEVVAQAPPAEKEEVIEQEVEEKTEKPDEKAKEEKKEDSKEESTPAEAKEAKPSTDESAAIEKPTEK